MVFNFAAFDQGVQASKDDFRKRRAENAALYADYIQSNPDASVDQRSEFAANLAGNSNFLKNALPSRSVMEQNVSRRKTELAQAAADRERKQLNQNITLANTLSGVYGSAYVSGGEEQALSAIKDLAGDVLPEAALPLVKQFGVQKAREIVNERMGPKFEIWKTAGANPNDISTWENTVSENAKDLLAPWISQANATLKGLQQQDLQKATAAATSVVNTGDEVQVNNFADPKNLAALYPHLGDQLETVRNETLNNYQGFKTQKEQRMEAAVKTSTEAVVKEIKAGNITSVQDGVAKIEAEGRTVDPNFELPPNYENDLEAALDERLRNENAKKDTTENALLKTEVDEMLGPQQFIAGGDPTGLSKIEEQIKVMAQGLVTDDDGPKAEVLASQALSKITQFSQLYNIPINDDFMWSELSKVALEYAKTSETDPAKVPDSQLRAAADRVMQARSDPQAKAYMAALGNFGVTSMNELADIGQLGQWNDAYSAAVQDVLNKSKDVYEAGIYTPEHIENKIKQDVQAAKRVGLEVVQGGADGRTVLSNADYTLKLATTPDNLGQIVDGIYNNSLALGKQQQQVMQQIQVLKDRKRRSEARLQSPEFMTTEMFPTKDSAQKSVALIDQELQKLANLYDTLSVRRSQLQQKAGAAIADNASPDMGVLENIADLIGPLAMSSTTDKKTQMEVVGDYVDQAIPDGLQGLQRGVVKKVLTELVKINLDYVDPDDEEAVKQQLSRQIEYVLKNVDPSLTGNVAPNITEDFNNNPFTITPSDPTLNPLLIPFNQ